MRHLFHEKIQRMEHFDVPAVKLIQYLHVPLDETVLARLSDNDANPVWRYFALQFLIQYEVPIDEMMFVGMLENTGWIEPLIAVALIGFINEDELPSPEIVLQALFRGLDMIQYFQTDRAVQYLERIDQIVERIIHKDNVRPALAAVFPMCIELAWAHIASHSPRFFSFMARFICRFIRYPEFAEFIDPFIIEPFLGLFQRNSNQGFEFASKIILRAPVYLERVNGMIPMLARMLQKKVEFDDWSTEMIDIALYFVVNGEANFDQICLNKLETGIEVLLQGHFMTFTVAVMQKSQNLEVLEWLFEARGTNFFRAQGLSVAISLLYLEGKELYPNHIREVIRYCTEYQANFHSASISDRLIFAFLCHLLITTRDQEWQNIYDLTMEILRQFLRTNPWTVFELKRSDFTHQHLLCRGIPWIFEDWTFYIETVVRGLHLPPDIAERLSGNLE
jgi:hypothetical protein